MKKIMILVVALVVVSVSSMIIAKENKKIVAITAAMTDGTGLTEFAKKYPTRFFYVFIAVIQY